MLNTLRLSSLFCRRSYCSSMQMKRNVAQTECSGLPMSVKVVVQEIVVINDNCCILSQRLTRLAVISARKNSYVALIVTNCIVWKWLHKSVGNLFAKASYKVRFAKLHGLAWSRRCVLKRSLQHITTLAINIRQNVLVSLWMQSFEPG